MYFSRQTSVREKKIAKFCKIEHALRKNGIDALYLENSSQRVCSLY